MKEAVQRSKVATWMLTLVKIENDLGMAHHELNDEKFQEAVRKLREASALIDELIIWIRRAVRIA